MSSIQQGPVRETFLPYCLHEVDDEDIAEVVDTLRSSWLTTGPKVQELQQRVAAYVGAPHAVAVNSATAGLHLVLAALGIGPGDEVITTPLTFCATAEVVEYQHARPVFVDVEPDTQNLNPALLEAAITPRTRVILPVHFAGHPCPMEEILAIAERHGIFVLEDAAHAIGAQYRGRMIGNIGDATVFSFYATKNMTTGEGGMITCRDEELAKTLQMLSLHGIDRNAWKRYSAEGSWYYEVRMLGYKYNLTDIAAALGLRQLEKLKRFNARRRAIAARYDAAFAPMPEITTLVVRPEVVTAAHLYVIKLAEERLTANRADFIEELRAEGIGASVHFLPLHLQPYYRDRYGYAPGAYPVAEDIARRCISLPLYPRMTDGDVEDVIAAVGRIIEAHRR
ncbi:MAG: UDP-4-amino-4,6-dideoxy-N-acetyl-beta-L-altrosamine transaminase [Armatimonadota bacterium]